MPATIHLIDGQWGTLRRERLLCEFRRACSGFRSALLLTPTRRLADQLREMLGTSLSPLIYDLQAFADELVRRHDPAFGPHCQGDRRLLIDLVLAELSKNALPHFAEVAETRGFAEAAAGYVSELKDAGIDLRPLLRANPLEGENPTRHQQAIRVFERYQRRLARSYRFDPCDRLGRAARLWEQSKRRPFEAVRSVFAVGFTAINPSQRSLLDAVRESAEQFWMELLVGEGEIVPQSLRSRLIDASRHCQSPLQSESVDAPSSRTVAVHLIKAAGELGEARLVARRVRRSLECQMRPERVLVVARHFTPSGLALFQEVFDEYGIPHDAEGTTALGHAPAVAFLLRAWRLPIDGWEFAPVASVLRSTYFRPEWPELEGDPELPVKAEALLRMLGEARGRESYLRAVATWEEMPPERLEDEQLDESSRQKKQRLSRQCRPFLERFFRTWEEWRPEGTATAAVSCLKQFADEIGLNRAPPDDLEDLARLWSELDRWARGESTFTGRKLLRPERFFRVLQSLSSVPCRVRSIRGRGVAILSAENAAGLDCDCLCLVGLGEGSWPDLTAPISLLDDGERQRLRQNGYELDHPSERLAREQLLFNALITSPHRELVLSYPAVDSKGQVLLPCSFLREYLEKTPKTSVSHQQMLLDRYFEQDPMCEAELRTRSARERRLAPSLRPALLDNLSRAQTVAQARFESTSHTAFDGQLRDSAVAVELAKRVGLERVFSATALENYIACPFRFLLQHVLRLQPLEDPSEEIEYTRRGSAVHRALARFHERVKAQGSYDGEELPSTLTDELVQQIEQAIGEYADRAPSRATAELWKLEGQRLARAARRYRSHWRAFREPWRERKVILSPHHFEAGFGMAAQGGAPPLVLSIDGIEVRIGGYIDRVDLVQLEETLGFWVIDYKTGRATSYQPSQVSRFEKLQLPLYALAVERVLLKEQRARPLGLAYWLVTDIGVKSVLPVGRNAALSWIDDAETWSSFSKQLEDWVGRIVGLIRAGDFPLAPRSETCTDTCSFGCVCRISQSRSTKKVFALELPVVENGTESG